MHRIVGLIHEVLGWEPEWFNRSDKGLPNDVKSNTVDGYWQVNFLNQENSWFWYYFKALQFSKTKRHAFEIIYNDWQKLDAAPDWTNCTQPNAPLKIAGLEQSI